MSGATLFIRALPNLLTSLRLVLAVAFPCAPESWRLAMVATAAATDAVDGVLARKLRATSALGALLDGVADKAFAGIIIGTFAVEGTLEWWQAGLLLSRDITVILIYAYVSARRNWRAFRTVAARPAGKITTLLLFAFMLAVLGWAGAAGAAPPLMYIAIGASVIAAIDYVLVLSRAMHSEPPRP